MTHSRRDFLLGGLSTGAAIPLLQGSLWGMADNIASSGKTLVVIQVDGGWDYFNQIVPGYSPEYYAARPDIGIPDKVGSTLPIAKSVAEKWPVFAKPWKDLYDRGDLAVLNNVGYPNPNLSHFQSQARWGSASPGTDGWLANYLRKAYRGPQTIPALEVSMVTAAAFEGARVPLIGLGPSLLGFQTDPRTPADNKVEVLALEAAASTPRSGAANLLYTTNVMRHTFGIISLLRNAARYHRPRVQYPFDRMITPFVLRIAGLIAQGFPSHVIYLRLGSFDDHAKLADKGGTTGKFAHRLGSLAGNIKAFLDDMKAYGKSNEVVVLVHSEFSRRFGQNGSIGTDHGHGGVAYLAGAPVRGGWHGKYPDLTKATKPYADWYPDFGKDSIDYRRLYATVLEKWLGVSSKLVLGATYPTLPIL